MSSRFFTVGQRGGHWWFITPTDEPFFSLGMNHIDSATLRHPENLEIWRETYANDQRRWIRANSGMILLPDNGQVLHEPFN